MAATSKERRLPEFGLGEGPAYPGVAVLEKFNITISKRIFDYEIMQSRLPPSTYEARHANESKKETIASLFGVAVSYKLGKKGEWRKDAVALGWESAVHSCDLFCLIRSTEHYYLKGKLGKVLKLIDAAEGA